MNGMMEPLKLSLATFQPDKCYPPYLNTPRSLEACRLNGVNPVELVEIPFGEFQKDHPNDIDTANRRFERVDGARRRVLANVLKDWKQLVQTGWQPPESRKKTSNEAIVEASPSAHCTLLELQAQKFRKIEQDNWTTLQRNLRLELVKADNEVRYNQILEKHEDIAQANEGTKKQRQAHRDAQIQEQILRKKEEEDRRMAEIKAEQEEFCEKARREAEEKKLNAFKEKQLREQREAERVARGEYTKQIKGSIIAGLENKMKNRKKLHDMREKNDEERVREVKEQRQKEIEERKRALEERIAQVKEEQKKHMEETQQAMLERIRENERHRQQVEEAREQNKRLQISHSDAENYEKMMQIRRKTQEQVEEKARNTLRALQLKEELARQELEKVKEAQEKRKLIKALRQEAYTINAMREKKKEEYRMAKVQKQLQDKEERLKAIKQGFHVLSSMRTSMKDIMEKTNYEIKTEMERLKHASSFSPNNVVERAMEVSKEVLFPRLERTFGFVSNEGTSSAPKLFNPHSEHFSFDLGERPATAPTGDEDKSREASEEGQNRLRGRSPAKVGRGPTPTLKIQTLQEDKLRTALFESMRRVEKMNSTGLMSRSVSPKRRSPSQTQSPSGRGGNGGEEGEEGAAILHLPDEQISSPQHARSSASPAARRDVSSREQSREKGGGRYVGKSALAKTAGEDTKLPIFAFTAGSEFKDADKEQSPPSKEQKSPGGHKKGTVTKLRNDVNEKARFMPVPAGKFRREFSSDHPLAQGGKGTYKKEMHRGMTPQGLPLELPKKESKSLEENVSEAIEMAEKVEKLTYEAQTSVVDEVDDVEKLRKDLNEVMKVLLEEERKAEDERLRVMAGITDPEEKSKIDQIFAEERKRASEKIIAATREYDKTIKRAMLKTVNLGKAL